MAIVTGKAAALGLRTSVLKTYRTRWSSKKKLLEDTLSADDAVTKILEWIRKEDDPEPTLEDIKFKVSPNDRYENCAQWFLEGSEYQCWSKGFQNLENECECKQALWIHG